MREAKILAASCNPDSLNSERAANAILTDEIERLNKNMQFAAAINLAMQEAGQDLPDLRGHECLAKHKLLSLFDLWRKKVRPRLPGFIDDEISRRDKLIEQMRELLQSSVEDWAHKFNHDENPAHGGWAVRAGKILNELQALSAAERGGK